jgi:hypothetical protein
MRTIYVTAQWVPTILPAPPNQLTAHNIEVSSFVTIGKTRRNHHHHDDDTSLFFSLYSRAIILGGARRGAGIGGAGKGGAGLSASVRN